MKAFHIKSLSLLAFATLFSNSASADQFSLGASAAFFIDPYRGTNNRFYPVPAINYEGDDFYFRTLMGGYYLWKDQNNKLSVTAGYAPFGFSPSNSYDSRMKKLSKRRGTMMAGLAYTYHDQWGMIRASLDGDVIDNSNGIVGDVAYLYSFKQDNWTIVPGVGVVWNSANQNRYYYGISSNESRRSTLESYRPSDSFNPYVEISAKYDINKQWQAFFSGRYVHLDSEIKDSPMVSKDYAGLLWTGINYTF